MSSGLPSEADIVAPGRYVSRVPGTDSPPQQTSLFDHLVSKGKQRRRQLQSKRFGGLEVENKIIF